MDDLIAFITARLDEDEHIAQMAAEDASASPNWHVDARYEHSGHAGVSGENGEIIVYDEGSPAQMEAEHIARHDPARVLREVEAKREILRRHAPDGSDPANCLWCSEHERPYPWPCPDVLSLAAVWSDHPDYRPEWKP